MIQFDDIPPQSSEATEPMPVFEPYHRFWYSEGFTVVPPPVASYRPSSGNLMLQYTPSSISNTSRPESYPDMGDIGVGPQMYSSCFQFNFTGVNLGCESKEAPCSFTFTGYRYDHFQTRPELVATQKVSVPICTKDTGCALTPVTLSNFNGLTSFTITAGVNGKATVWWADDFTFGWSQNDCDSGACRSRVRNVVKEQGWATAVRRAGSKLMGLIRHRG